MHNITVYPCTNYTIIEKVFQYDLYTIKPNIFQFFKGNNIYLSNNYNRKINTFLEGDIMNSFFEFIFYCIWEYFDYSKRYNF